MTDKAGIYIHFPFCLKKCLYCGFYSIPHCKKLENKYIDCLIKEINLQKEKTNHLNFRSIYLGGGTPSLMSINNLTKILKKIYNNFKINNNAEITLEVNPASVTTKKIKELFSTKINRISLGIQSFDDNILKFIGRPHSAKAAIDTYNDFSAEKFNNINTDLIFAIPGQTMAQWKKSLYKLINLSPAHISLYSFSFDKDTHFTRLYKNGKINIADELLETKMYKYAITYLSNNGYRHYEISNFALSGFESNHNKLYWQNYSYVGLGASAFSYIRKKRYCAVSDTNKYIKFLKNNKNPYNYCELLDEEKSLRETAALNLRLINEGINIKKIQARYKKLNVKQLLKSQLEKLVAEGLLKNSDEIYTLTQKGVLLADYAASSII